MGGFYENLFFFHFIIEVKMFAVNTRVNSCFKLSVAVCTFLPRDTVILSAYIIQNDVKCITCIFY